MSLSSPASASAAALLVSSLCRGNMGVLSQKLNLMDLLVTKYGSNDDDDVAREKFTAVCPVVGASIGQHFRHSTDHIELAALVARSNVVDDGTTATAAAVGELRYDLRIRGGNVETDLTLARERVVAVTKVLEELDGIVLDRRARSAPPEDDDDDRVTINDLPVVARFMLDGDSNEEFPLQSTIGRELGFAAHHGIHHMAMVRIIATNFLGIRPDELPKNFGRAPSTVRHDSDNNR